MAARREDIDDSDVQRMYYEEGMTHQEIADYYGVSYPCIYYRLHPEENRERSKKWRLEHPEYNKQWQLENHEYIKEYNKEYYQDHSEEIKEQKKEYGQTENGKLSMRKHAASRRSLGSIELNKPFPNSEGHHIDDAYIIHIPKELHRSIPHNLKTGQGMEEINTIAFRYITEETFDKLIAGEI